MTPAWQGLGKVQFSKWQGLGNNYIVLHREEVVHRAKIFGEEAHIVDSWSD